MTDLLDPECQALGQHQLIWDGHALCCADLRWLQRMGAPVPHVAGRETEWATRRDQQGLRTGADVHAPAPALGASDVNTVRSTRE